MATQTAQNSGRPAGSNAPPVTLMRRASTFLYRHPFLMLVLLLLPPLLWLGLVYLGSLSALMVNSFFFYNSYAAQVEPRFSLASYGQLLTTANLEIIARTASMAAAVTVACAILAFPLSYYMARYASPRIKGALYLSVLLPLWSSYIIRVYSWKLILAQEGIINWFIQGIGLGGALDALLKLPGIGGASLTVSPIGMFLVFVYVWLPYMILPVEAALERVSESVLEASGDLGARPLATFWRITLPLAFPGVVAGSIFTFSLTLGDFIVPSIVSNSSYFIGKAVQSHLGTSGNLPLAAAFTVVPMAIMAIYLTGAKRLGAFDAL